MVFVPRAALNSGCGLMGHAGGTQSESLTPIPIARFPATEKEESVFCIRFPHMQGFDIMSGDRYLKTQVWYEMVVKGHGRSNLMYM